MSIRLDLIGIVAKDIPASLRFYRMLGIDIPEPAEGEDHVEAKLPNGLRMAWDQVDMIKSFSPHWVEPEGHRMGLAFLCDGPADVDAKHQEITGAGFESAMEPWDAFWGQRYAQVKDPDGNVVDLFASL
jgi:uncharacterized glyoxalase superfamily protein PhnB